MHLTCDRCSTEFDTDREPVTPHQDTTRCPACGQSHDVDAGDGQADTGAETAIVADDVQAAPATPVADGGDARDLTVTLEGLEGAKGEVHVHLHTE